jgi:hypothetical protein
MSLSEHRTPKPEAFRDFVQGVESLQAYLRLNDEKKLGEANKCLTESLTEDPEFAPAQYYKAIALTHAREAQAAIHLLEGLSAKDEAYKPEILYNLAFAYAKTYEYDRFNKALDLLASAYELSKRESRSDLMLLIKAMEAWVLGAFAGRAYDHPEDFEERKRTFLPRAAETAESILKDGRLRKLPMDTRVVVEVEASNAAGIAYMRMGQYSSLFSKGPGGFWHLAENNYQTAIAKHPRDVRVLDNISTFNLIRGCYTFKAHSDGEGKEFFDLARAAAQTAISYNSHDRFRHYNLSQSLAMLGDWDAASNAAEVVLTEPGAVKDVQVEKLKSAIAAKDKDYIVGLYFPLPPK